MPFDTQEADEIHGCSLQSKEISINAESTLYTLSLRAPPRNCVVHMAAWPHFCVLSISLIQFEAMLGETSYRQSVDLLGVWWLPWRAFWSLSRCLRILFIKNPVWGINILNSFTTCLCWQILLMWEMPVRKLNKKSLIHMFMIK